MSTNQIASIFGTKLSSAYNQLRGDLGVPQTATETIDKLVDKIQTSAAVEDRRTAVFGLKGLSRDWKEDVGRRALPSLIAVLEHDAPYDAEIAKAALETMMQLCETAEKPTNDDLGLFFVDAFLQNPKPIHSVVSLISVSTSFYPRFYSLQFLSQLLTARTSVAQSHIMSAPPPGIDGILAVLDSTTSSVPSTIGGGAVEMLRNEALLLLPVLLQGNQDLQKIVAFSGAFEKLFRIIEQEGGVDGGIVVHDSLTALGTLLRFNNYFRELTLIPQIPAILGFPSGILADVQTPDSFALQYWPEQKVHNTGLVLGLIRMLVGGPGGGNQNAMVPSGVTRCLLELSLASNAPPSIKTQCLLTLMPILTASPHNQDFLTSLQLSPLLAVHADMDHPNGGFVRMEPKPAVVALVGSIVEGDPANGNHSLRGRVEGVNLFEAYVSDNDEARIGILSSLIASGENLADQTASAGSLILSGILELPHTSLSPEFDPYRPLFASLLLSHIIRNSEHAKKLAREITFPSGDADPDSTVNSEEDRILFIQLVVGNLILAQREQQECVNQAAKEGQVETMKQAEGWTRVMVGYLSLLCTWLWDSPKSVSDFLSESNNLQALIQPITQNTSIDPLVQGLSAFLLGVCYEFNREPGEITRATLHPILHSRIGPDQFVSRMARLREDSRFRAVQPEGFEVEGIVENEEENAQGEGIWFDWAFVDFWKNHYYTIQRAIAIDPDAVRPTTTTSDHSETTSIILTLRSKLKAQTDEVIQLQTKLEVVNKESKAEKEQLAGEVEELGKQVASMTGDLQEKTLVIEKLQEDLSTLQEQYDKLKENAGTAELKLKELVSVREELNLIKAEHEKTLSELGLARMSAKGRENKFQDLEVKIKRLEEELAAEVSARQAAELAQTAQSAPNPEDNTRIEQLQKAEDNLEKERKDWTSKEATLNLQLKTQQNQVEQLQSRNNAAQKEAEESQLKTSEFEKKIVELEKKLKDAEEKLAAAPSSTIASTPEPGQGVSGKQAKKRAAELDVKVKELEATLAKEKSKREEEYKEHEDLLVLLDELSAKRQRDKTLMKEKGLDVSEDEEEADDE
nr:hypothetical protein L203_04651 [Cryptococcus depauperatus CBS 7841]